ncbi:MFS transporter [Candidatus Woesearchaeota archaeon]|jgi:MFS family permease|nr:MFS transporter [Candidatus Woesearchaeota archaeon]MBT3537142.1 MFS transporter [Candidatus Woesearchaeota archaeon]MBT4697731.1 MFS transporter [Candidatus Woesearchaeota archaeon]MBT4716565.1 MFS transporter [Candidatus Woesearchaeota archaeon]MBT7106548.1 MFS transporter [Candidatus Woesearchaeota archaeon]
MSIERNIYLYYLHNFFKTFSFWLPFVFIYLLSKGLNYTELLMLSVVAGLFQIAFEVPSGVYADFFGRKSALIVSAVAKSVCLGFYFFGQDFWVLCVAASFFGISLAFESGTDSAFIYDTLRDLEREKDYKRTEGIGFSFKLIGMATGSLIGGWLVSAGYDLPVVLTWIAFSVAVPVALLFKEPKHHKASDDKAYFTHLIKAAKFSWRHPLVRWLLVFEGVMVGVLVMTHKFHQPYMMLADIDVVFFGYIYVVWLLLSAASSRFAHVLENKLGRIGSLTLIVLFVGLPLLVVGMYVFASAVVLFLFGQFAWGFIRPVITDYINKEVDSHHRATVLSLGGFMGSVFIIIIAPFIGYVADLYSVTTAFLIDGVLGLVLGGVLLFLIRSAGTAKSVRS